MVKNKCASPVEYSRKFYTGKLCYLPFYIPFLTAKVPLLVYLILTNGTPSTDLVWNSSSHLTANPLSFEYEKIA